MSRIQCWLVCPCFGAAIFCRQMLFSVFSYCLTASDPLTRQRGIFKKDMNKQQVDHGPIAPSLFADEDAVLSMVNK